MSDVPLYPTCKFKGCALELQEADYCALHLEDLYKVRIAISHIPNGGKGLFTTIDRKRNQRVVPYGGARISSRVPIGGDYVIEYAPGRFIDGIDVHSSAARFCNDLLPEDKKRGYGKAVNCKYTYDKRTRVVWIETIKRIGMNEELFVRYGRKEYWSARKGHSSTEERMSS